MSEVRGQRSEVGGWNEAAETAALPGVQTSVVLVDEPRLCGCGKEFCRPGQRTGLQCHAELMKKYRGSRPPMQRMQIIWALIRSGTYPNATQLAAYLETSTKSVHRDLEFMRERLGFDIRYDGSRFGYGTGQGPTRCQFCAGEVFTI